MQKRRYEILLPLAYNDGRPIEYEKNRQAQEELIVRFTALSLAPGTVQGIWIHGGTRYEDASVRLVVDVEDTEENHQFFQDFKETLKQRFEQIEIYIIGFPIKVV